MFGLDPQITNQIILGVAGTLVSGAIGWAFARGPRMLRNFGKTKLQIALEEQAKAMKAVEAAAQTADLADDKLAAAAQLVADKHVDNAKLIASITDAAAEAAPSLQGVAEEAAKAAIPKIVASIGEQLKKPQG